MGEEYEWEPIDFFIFQKCNLEAFKREGKYSIMINFKWFISLNFKDMNILISLYRLSVCYFCYGVLYWVFRW